MIVIIGSLFFFIFSSFFGGGGSLLNSLQCKFLHQTFKPKKVCEGSKIAGNLSFIRELHPT